MANITPRPECMRNQGSQIYRITGKVTETMMQSCRALLTLSEAVSLGKPWDPLSQALVYPGVHWGNGG